MSDVLLPSTPMWPRIQHDLNPLCLQVVFILHKILIMSGFLEVFFFCFKAIRTNIESERILNVFLFSLCDDL